MVTAGHVVCRGGRAAERGKSQKKCCGGVRHAWGWEGMEVDGETMWLCRGEKSELSPLCGRSK